MKIIVYILSLLMFSVTIYSQSYEIKFDTLNASGWYGGDNRAGSQRNSGVAQSLTIDQPITLESFAFYFTAPFDSALNGTGTGHEVTLKLNIRDSLGSIIESSEVVVGDTFTGGWVFWNDIQLELQQPGKYIFSSYLVDGYDLNMVYSAQGCDFNAGYPGGERFGKDGTTNQSMEEWGDWSNHPWDSNFWLKGTVLLTDVNESIYKPIEFTLGQNYPNPFNPSTKINYSLPDNSFVSLIVYDVVGNKVAELVNGFKIKGEYDAEFNASKLTSGIYFYQLRANTSKGEIITTRKMTLLK